MKKNSQSSLEFIIIFGIGFIFISILGGIFLSYSSSAHKSLDKKQIDNFARELMSNVEKIYFLGSGNRNTMGFTFPKGIVNMSIIHVNSSTGILFDYLDIATYKEQAVSSSDYNHFIYLTNQEYIRFNCTACYQTANVNGNWTSYYNVSDFSQGFKQIQIESKGSFVSIDFYKRQ